MKIGEFVYDAESNTLTGPAEYMREQGNKFVEDALAGRSAVLNYALTNGGGSDPVRALLVALQTNYAGWKGTRDLVARRVA